MLSSRWYSPSCIVSTLPVHVSYLWQHSFDCRYCHVSKSSKIVGSHMCYTNVALNSRSPKQSRLASLIGILAALTRQPYCIFIMPSPISVSLSLYIPVLILPSISIFVHSILQPNKGTKHIPTRPSVKSYTLIQLLQWTISRPRWNHISQWSLGLST